MSQRTEMIEAWLNASCGVKRGQGLKRIVKTLAALGNPQHSFRSIHIAGTNGKGSTVAYAQQLFCEHGITVGSFVSPHMVSYHDRILLNGAPIESTDFLRLAQKLKDIEHALLSEQGKLSYFEIMTVIMFLYFAERSVDVALIEVGIGGLQDVTNVIDSDCSAITSIGLDHQALLGNTFEEITIHKSGIFKPHTTAVIGPLPAIAQTVCQYVADAHDVRLLKYGVDFTACEEDGQVVFTSVDQRVFRCERLGLIGSYQKENAAVALELFLQFCAKYGIVIEAERIERALMTTKWPGRMETMVEEPMIVIDGAHNIPAVERLLETLEMWLNDKRNVTLCFGALRKKDFEAMLKRLVERLPQVAIHIVSFEEGDAIERSDIEHLLGEHIHFELDYASFITQWQQMAQRSDILVITGSLYFIADVRTNYFQQVL